MLAPVSSMDGWPIAGHHYKDNGIDAHRATRAGGRWHCVLGAALRVNQGLMEVADPFRARHGSLIGARKTEAPTTSDRTRGNAMLSQKKKVSNLAQLCRGLGRASRHA